MLASNSGMDTEQKQALIEEIGSLSPEQLETVQKYVCQLGTTDAVEEEDRRYLRQDWAGGIGEESTSVEL